VSGVYRSGCFFEWFAACFLVVCFVWFNAYMLVWVYCFGDFLSSFVVFGNWTEQGIKKVTETP